MALLRQVYRTSQPQHALELDTGNSLSIGATAWSANFPLNLIGSKSLKAISETGYDSSPIGVAGRSRKWSRSAGAGVDFGTNQLYTGQAVTVLVLAAPTSEAFMKSAFSQRQASGAFPQVDFIFNGTGDGLSTLAGTVELVTYDGGSRGVTALSQCDGKTHCWVASNSTTSGYILRDGVQQTLSQNSQITSNIYSASQKLCIGRLGDDTGSSTYQHNDPLYLVIVWNRQLSLAEAKKISENPWQIFKPQSRQLVSSVVSGPVVYTLTGLSGSYTTAGQSATLLKSKLMTAQTGTYNYSGINATITFVPSSSVYTLTAQTGSYNYSGTLATLLKHNRLQGLSGTYAVTGQAVNINRHRNLITTTGTYNLSGQQVTITRTTSTPVYTITAQAGSYNITGTVATLLKHRSLSAQTGDYVYNGKPITIDKYAVGGSGGLEKYFDVVAGELLILKPLGTTTPTGGTSWGSITGTLSSQVDLQASLDAKIDDNQLGVTVQAYSADTVIDANYVHTDNNFTTAEKSKLSGIAAGAEVNVNADWAAGSGDAQILNKPNLSAVAISGSYGDLSGTPVIPAQFNPIAGTNVSLTGSYPNITFNASGGGGGSVNIFQVSLDFGNVPVYSKSITFSDVSITPSSRIIMTPHGDSDELEMDGFVCSVKASTGSAVAYIQAIPGPVTGTRIFNYMIG